MLRLEHLEQRQLMAFDLMPFHNSIVAADVNGDFSISPLDALVVINRLNSQGSGSLAGQAPTDINSFVDTDNDNFLSPLDALVVINAINSGEGVGERAEVRYKFFSVNADGTAGTELPDPRPLDGIPEATIGTGERIIVRTQMIDLRTDPGNPQGVFSAYHDLSYTNADNSTTEKLQFQWGEYNQIDIGSSVRAGTFTIRYGAQTTAAIAPAFITTGSGARIYDAAGTAVNIQNALQSLSSIGAGNVRVRTLNNATTSRFGVNFVGSLAHTDVPNILEVGANNLVDGAIPPVAVTLTIGQNSADPALDIVAAVARNNELKSANVFGAANGLEYINGLDGRLLPAVAGSPTRTITLMGGFSNKNSLVLAEAAEYVSVVDTLFRGASVGQIRLSANTSPPPAQGSTGNNLGIALYGGLAQYLTSNVVLLGTGIININDKLTANPDSTSIAEDSGQTIVNVVSNDLNAVGPNSAIQVTGVSPISATVGTVSVNGTTNIAFTPAANYFGPATFTYTIRNNATPPDTATGTVSINVTAVNDAPTIIATQFSVVEDPTSPIVITSAQIFGPGPANESGQTVTLSSFGTTPNGTVTLVGGSINFTPAANFFGNAIFTVTGTDNGTPTLSTVATITVNVTPVNDAPVPFSGTLTVAEDGSLVLIGAGAVTNILASSNPGPNEASTQTVRLVSIQSPTASAGTITTVGGITTYRPSANFFGTDTFTYTISDNATPTELTAVGTVTINVTPVNDAPVAVNDTGAAQFVVLGINVANSLDVRRNDDVGPLEPNDTITIVSVTTPTIGIATVNAAGTAVLFTPPTGSFNTTSRFSYTIRDAGGLTATANVDVLIIPPVLPFALTDTASVAEDSGEFTIDVIANDFANDLAIKSLLSFSQPLVSGTGAVALDDRGTPTNLTDDRLIYTPPENFFGDAVFTYVMNDDREGSVASPATVTITVTPVNDVPVAVNRNATATEDTELRIAGATITAGLSKGPGEDAQTLTVTNAVFEVNQPLGSAIRVENGDIVYTPAPDFNGTVLVLYTVRDNGFNNTTPAPLSATATLTITVSAVNDPPVANADTPLSTPENQSVTIAISTLLANDRPGPANEAPPIQTVSFVPFSGIIATARGGSVSYDNRSTPLDQTDDQLIYTPDTSTSFNGLDSFTYQISDGQSTLSTATGMLTVNVTEVNDAPTASTLTRSVFASVPTIFDLTADLRTMPKGPANESTQMLRVSRIIPDATTIGTIVLNANGTITYTAPLGASGRDTFRYEIIDNGTTNGVADPKTSIGTFNVDVSPFIPSAIFGTVYIDDNNSGTFDANELRMGGVEVALTVAATATTPSRTMTKQTHSNGTYAFELLPPGTYTVTYAVPAFTLDSPGANTFTRVIAAPGNINAEFNFSVLGLTPGYASVLENLASSFYAGNTSMRTSGMYAAVGANGRSEWTIARDGFEGDTFQEVVLSSDNRNAFLTAVRGPTRSVFTATLTRSQFLVVQNPNGEKIVRVLAKSSDLSWQQVSLAAPPVEIVSRAKSYLDAVDELFLQESW